MSRLFKISILVQRQFLAASVAGLFLILGPTQKAQANNYADLIHILCVPELGLFEFSNVRASGIEALRALEEMPDELAAKYGLYESNAYIDFESVPTRSGLRALETRKGKIRCDLDGSVVDVVFEPEWLPPDLSYRVTLRIDGRLVMDNLPFNEVGRDSNGIWGFSYSRGNDYLTMDGGLGPKSRPYLPVYGIGRLFKFGPEIPPMRDYKTVFEKMVDGLEPPRSQRRR